MSKELYSNCRGAKVIQVIIVEVNEGEGTMEDPVCRVQYLYHTNGKFIACTDPTNRKFHDDEVVDPQKERKED